LLIDSVPGGEGGTHRRIRFASASIPPEELPVVACTRFRGRDNFGARGRV
jgi:hypothetical protein